MNFEKRQYQQDLINNIYGAWNSGAKNVLGVLPTGGGKTWIFSKIIADHNGPAVVIAHRQEIVVQISLSLAKHGVRHKIIAPINVIKLINKLHMEKLGKSFYHPSAPVAVAGVDTLIRRDLNSWKDTVTLWVQDEAHHVLKENKWGIATTLFPNAKGLGVTATPVRADGKGLGRHVDGVFDIIVEGPGMRELINMDYLSDYRIFAPKNDLDMSGVSIGVNGDYTRPGMVNAVKKSKIIGDVVDHYIKIANGKLGITFAVDVQTATEIAEKFNQAGIPAAIVSAKTPASERISIISKFEKREILQLINVDLFGEGFDLPAVEVVIMARPTESYGLYCQQFGRALRIMLGKLHAIIIDHVGNVIRHGLPDRMRVWSLDRRERRKRDKDDDIIPVKVCPECSSVYERIYRACPYCGFIPLPMARSAPEFVDGDLTELDLETLNRMRGEIVNTEMTPQEYLSASKACHLPHIAAMSAAKQFRLKQEAQVALRESIALWAGYQRSLGRPDYESYRRFYFLFGIDVLSAQALKTKDANELKNNIDKKVNIE